MRELTDDAGTGDTEVDEALRVLDGLDTLPVHEHADVVEKVHQVLQDRLTTGPDAADLDTVAGDPAGPQPDAADPDPDDAGVGPDRAGGPVETGVGGAGPGTAGPGAAGAGAAGPGTAGSGAAVYRVGPDDDTAGSNTVGTDAAGSEAVGGEATGSEAVGADAAGSEATGVDDSGEG